MEVWLQLSATPPWVTCPGCSLMTWHVMLCLCVSNDTHKTGLEMKPAQTKPMAATFHSGSCSSAASWSFQVCRKCDCDEGLVWMHVTHTLSTDSPKECSTWFTQLDQAFRFYVA